MVSILCRTLKKIVHTWPLPDISHIIVSFFSNSETGWVTLGDNYSVIFGTDFQIFCTFSKEKAVQLISIVLAKFPSETVTRLLNSDKPTNCDKFQKIQVQAHTNQWWNLSSPGYPTLLDTKIVPQTAQFHDLPDPCNGWHETK